MKEWSNPQIQELDFSSTQFLPGLFDWWSWLFPPKPPKPGHQPPQGPTPIPTPVPTIPIPTPDLS